MHKHIVHVIPSLSLGGAQTMLLQLVRSLAKPFFTHTILNLSQGGRVAPLLEAEGARVVHLGMPPGIPNLGGLSKLLETAVTEPADVLQGWRYHGNVVAQTMRSAMRPQPPVIWTLHSLGPQEEGPELANPQVMKMNAMLSQRATAIAYTSAASMEVHATHGFAQEQATRVPGGIDTRMFAPNRGAAEHLRTRLGIAQTARIIGLCAPLEVPKEPATFFMAMNYFDQPDVHFVVVGEGCAAPLPPTVDILIPASVRPRVHCLGPQRDMAAILQGLDICTRTSRFDALPRTLMEAMACETLCVATSPGDCPALLEDVGWSILSGQPQMLAETWQKVFDCSAEELQSRRRAGRARIEQEHTAMQMAEAFMQLYGRAGPL